MKYMVLIASTADGWDYLRTYAVPSLGAWQRYVTLRARQNALSAIAVTTGRKTIILNAPALVELESIPRLGEFVIAGRDPAEGQKERPRSDLKKPWAAICRHARLEGLRLHDLRHSFASVGAGAGLGLPIVGKLLGHTEASTTQRYAHLDNDPLRRASNTIAEEIAAALAGTKRDRSVSAGPGKPTLPNRN